MSWLTPSRRERVQILTARLNPNDDGGGDLVFGKPLSEGFGFSEFDQLSPILIVWMGLKPITFQGTGTKYIRGEQINENVTHEFSVRRIEVASLGKQYGLAFSIQFKFMADLMGLKSDYFLFIQRSSTVKGRLFRIHDVRDHKEQREYLLVSAEEIEERGTGWGV